MFLFHFFLTRLYTFYFACCLHKQFNLKLLKFGTSPGNPIMGFIRFFMSKNVSWHGLNLKSQILTELRGTPFPTRYHYFYQVYNLDKAIVFKHRNNIVNDSRITWVFWNCNWCCIFRKKAVKPWFLNVIYMETWNTMNKWLLYFSNLLQSIKNWD